MPNTKIFTTSRGRMAPAANAINEAGGAAYLRDPKSALVQYALTGTFNATFYVSAETQVATLIQLCDAVEPEFVAKTAVYARTRGFMKDMPAALLAYLTAKRENDLLALAWGPVVDSPRVLRTYVQMVRSGVFGRKSFGSAPRRLIRGWLAGRSAEQLFFSSVGNDPSIADVIKMVHPDLPAESDVVARYLLGKEGAAADEALPAIVKAYEAYKREPGDTPPAAPFELLTGLPLTDGAWAEIARNASWTQSRMNLNTFKRHNVFGVDGLVDLLANRLEDSEAAKRARAMPYELLAAWLNTVGEIPDRLTTALERAMDAAVNNVPEIAGKVVVFVDVSGSMASPITGYRKGASSKVRCVDVAALIASAIVRKNPGARVMPFDIYVYPFEASGGGVMDVARKLAGFGGGGTNCSLPLAQLNAESASADLLIYVSDNESWVDRASYYAGAGTGVMQEWEKFRARNPRAKLACIDLTPDTTTQAPNRADSLNIGGFSDAVFDVLAMYAKGELDGSALVAAVEAA